MKESERHNRQTTAVAMPLVKQPYGSWIQRERDRKARQSISTNCATQFFLPCRSSQGQYLDNSAFLKVQTAASVPLDNQADRAIG